MLSEKLRLEIFQRQGQQSCKFQLSTLHNHKVGPAKNYGKMFRSQLANAFSGIVHLAARLTQVLLVVQAAVATVS